MDLKNKDLTRYLHCPNCNNMYIIMDREIIACPECNLFKIKKFKAFKRRITTPIQRKCNYDHNYYENVKNKSLERKILKKL